MGCAAGAAAEDDGEVMRRCGIGGAAGVLRAVDLCGGAASIDIMGACAVIVAMFVPDAALACPVGCERLLPLRSCGLQWVGVGKNEPSPATEERMTAG